MSVDAVLNWALHTGISVSLLIMLVLVVRRPFTRKFGARTAYWLWALPLIRLVLPAIPLTINLPNWLASAPEPSNAVVVPIQFEAVVSSPAAAQINWQTPVLMAWLAVAAIWLAVQIMRQRKFLKSIGETSITAPKPVQIQAAEICKTLNMSVPDVRLASTNVGPLVTGMFRPVIVLPYNFEEGFSGDQQHFALIHELAHIKRRDLWAAFGALVFRALNWPNPLVHWAAAKFRIDQEAACDAYVLNVIGESKQTRQNYAATLIHCAKLTKTPTVQAQQTSPLNLTIYHPLKERLMTLKTSKTNSTILSRIGAASMLVAALALTAPVTIASDSPETQTNPRKVMKWTKKIDGVETSKHIEVITENGVTTAYSIDEHGNKTVIDASEIQILEGAGIQVMADRMLMMDGSKTPNAMKVFVTDGEFGKKRIKFMMGVDTEGMTGDDMLQMKDGALSKIILKAIIADAGGNIAGVDNAVIHMAGGVNEMQASAMVSAAQSLLNQADILSDAQDLSPKTRRKLDKARKALKEAQEALAAEE
ncbi:MAG: hypothetical protein JKY25_04370 [Robiginitomaculum sp.]|nr:hypothetical protein [Robiginitomaculum sp.]